ncbi:HOP2 [Symbiodinium natans]|uniref:HOP2 protein n=1 Tax=Symbiodinium natans TaxID=878477 RepID=A0A812GPP0_9DINO|nr:HOP2 [Symbiodinium natans]
MSAADLHRLVHRATPRVEDVRAPDRTDFIRREHGHLPLREVVDALDALEFSSASFLRQFSEVKIEKPAKPEFNEAEACVLSEKGRLERYATTPAAPEKSDDTCVHQLHRLLEDLRVLCPCLPSDKKQEAAPQEEASSPTSDWKEVVADEKAKGSDAFKQKDFRRAIDHYTRAIRASPKEVEEELKTLHTLYSNRSAARLQVEEAEAALADARLCVQLAPSWPKGYFRLGTSLRQLQRFDEAIEAFIAGRSLEPENKDWEKEVEKTQQMLEASPAAQVRQLIMQLLPDILATWFRAADPEGVLQIQVNGRLRDLGACKWRRLRDGAQPAKAQIRYAFLHKKGYLANLAANLQSPSPEAYAVTDLEGKPIKIPDVSAFFWKTDFASVHIDIKDDDGAMKAIL